MFIFVTMKAIEILKQWENAREDALHGRYICLSDIEPALFRKHRKAHLTVIGTSVAGRPIYSYRIGTGPTRTLMWSQMHGNESTATKAIFDLLNFLESGSGIAQKLLRSYEFCIIPMLNPDGAEVYTRQNENKIDLNRDFLDLSQPESRALRMVLDDFQPSYCLNLHDQRTIFGVGDTGKPATISLLAPAYDEKLQFNECRTRAVTKVLHINKLLQELIPGQVGRFDDSFNMNCAGDHFQFLGFPTILIEAGHYPDDYHREIVRKYFFCALVASFETDHENDIVNNIIEDYMLIPQNKANFYDIVYRNVKICYDGIEKITNFAVQYREELAEATIQFKAYIADIGALVGFFGHIEYNAAGAAYSDAAGNMPVIGQQADFSLGANTKVVNGVKV